MSTYNAREHALNVRSYMHLMMMVRRGWKIWPPGASQEVIDQASERFLAGHNPQWYYHQLPSEVSPTGDNPGDSDLSLSSKLQ